MAFCRPGMKGCILVGKVTFPDGVVPAPVWPEGSARGRTVAGSDREGPGAGDGGRTA